MYCTTASGNPNDYAFGDGEVRRLEARASPGTKNGLEMVKQQEPIRVDDDGEGTEARNGAVGLEGKESVRPSIVYSHSDPFLGTVAKEHGALEQDAAEEILRTESRDAVSESIFPSSLFFRLTRGSVSSTRKESSSACRVSPVSSRPSSPGTASSRPSLRSRQTSASVLTISTASKLPSPDSRRRPSILSRLRSSMSTASGGTDTNLRPIVHPADFGHPPEFPEKRFIDSVGMVIPGVCDRIQCLRSSSHFIITWRLCEPIEYTTALADHGITFSDYTRLLAALGDFQEDIPNEIRTMPRTSDSLSSDPKGRRRWLKMKDGSLASGIEKKVQSIQKKSSNIEPNEQLKKTEEQARSLHKLLADITWNLRARDVPIMLCVGSFSLFSPTRISECHIQVLHVPLESRRATDGAIIDYWSKKRSPDGFTDPFSHSENERHNSESLSISIAARKRSCNRCSLSPPSPTAVAYKFLHPHQVQQRDRSLPWPLWPNAIPVRKRGLIETHAERYGIDPYFRAWVRANVNSRTRSTSYAKYMIEKGDNPLINKRLEYIQSPPRAALSWTFLSGGYQNRKQQYPSIVNRDNYEHNRKLEARKTVELGFRLRLARFAFRHPLYPPHTPEMEKLGLSTASYEKVLSHIENIRLDHLVKPHSCETTFLPLIRKFRRRGPEAAIPEVIEYIKKLNSKQRGIVWTIEEIPGVYERGIGRKGREWEISVWNGEDPFELLLQLEKWGIIEKRLTNEDDDDRED
ncbi:hypothetical protein CC78DRAFT_572308 [Lojkania enalia]|uniref:Uncharacterized protein n=1 Tax=Lojkania enalia TaxID=147567 RepID=A0A9P4JZK4_9PLEO|nr:hypothetical protein CC78DRAFT_572308 [Didymosphaeria enalia]